MINVHIYRDDMLTIVVPALDIEVEIVDHMLALNSAEVVIVYKQ